MIRLSAQFLSRPKINIHKNGDYEIIIREFKKAERKHITYSGKQIIDISKAIQSNKNITIFDKVNLLRELIYQQALKNEPNLKTLLDINQILFQSKTTSRILIEIIDEINKKNKGVFCAGTATILSLLYKALGYNTWLYCYGDLTNTAGLSHTVTLIELNKKIYIQDAHFNYTYVDQSNKMISIFDILQRNKLGNKVYIDNGKLMYRRILIKNKEEFLSCETRKIDPRSPKSSAKNHIFWASFKYDSIDCWLKATGGLALKLVSKDYKTFNPSYLVNYPVWVTDMDTLIYYPFSKYKKNEIFTLIVNASNRS